MTALVRNTKAVKAGGVIHPAGSEILIEDLDEARRLERAGFVQILEIDQPAATVPVGDPPAEARPQHRRGRSARR
ncbi:hypothetical protein [Salinarimonas rosea]|uniref:hypothetical protein n=1 Tax=Salinarimonas rosea TaxID=552063 RepID=UPI0003F7B8B5|nr:hypothetical protein [Salinarimonas rosea]